MARGRERKREKRVAGEGKREENGMRRRERERGEWDEREREGKEWQESEREGEESGRRGSSCGCVAAASIITVFARRAFRWFHRPRDGVCRLLYLPNNCLHWQGCLSALASKA